MSQLGEQPFFKVQKTLLPVSTLHSLPIVGAAESISIPAELGRQLLSRSPAERSIIQLRIFPATTAADEIPHDCEVAVAGQRISTMPATYHNYQPGPTRHHPRPINITNAVLAGLRSSPPLRDGVWCLQLTVRWRDNRRGWRAGVWAVERVGVDALRDRLLADSAKKIGRAASLQAIKRLYTTQDADVDVIDGAPRVSLKCPISFTRMVMPAKGASCAHLQCFDLSNYLSMQKIDDDKEKAPKWRCPLSVCNQPVAYSQLRIDEYTRELLTTVPTRIESLELMADGQWVDAEAPKPKKASSIDGSGPRGKRASARKAKAPLRRVLSDSNSAIAPGAPTAPARQLFAFTDLERQAEVNRSTQGSVGCQGARPQSSATPSTTTSVGGRPLQVSGGSTSSASVRPSSRPQSLISPANVRPSSRPQSSATSTNGDGRALQVSGGSSSAAARQQSRPQSSTSSVNVRPSSRPQSSATSTNGDVHPAPVTDGASAESAPSAGAKRSRPHSSATSTNGDARSLQLTSGSNGGSASSAAVASTAVPRAKRSRPSSSAISTNGDARVLHIVDEPESGSVQSEASSRQSTTAATTAAATGEECEEGCRLVEKTILESDVPARLAKILGSAFGLDLAPKDIIRRNRRRVVGTRK